MIKFSLPKHCLRTLYFALIHPHLTYGILAWGNSKATLLNKTDTLQKRALRSINNKKYNSHSDPLFKLSGVLKISDLYQMEALLFMFDYINNGLPKSFNGTFDYIYARENTYVTRQRYMFDLPRTKSRFVDKLPLFNFPNIWNKNLSNFNFKTSRKCYKRTIKSTFLDSYKVNVICNNPFCLDCHNV